MDNIERELMKSLQAPFPAEDVEWRAQRSGIKNNKAWALVMPYLTNRAIQERLDEVFGVMGWSNEFKLVEGGFLCGIRATIDGVYTTKWDGADLTDIESFKGGLSGSMKRAAVQYGIGRYLYNLDTVFADLKQDRSGKFKVKIEGSFFTYDAPKLPDWALPKQIISTQRDKPKFEWAKELGDKVVVEPTSPEKQIQEGASLINRTNEASECKTLEELGEWYTSLPSEEKRQGSAGYKVKEDRKKELQTKHLASEDITPSKKYTLEVLKEMKLPELYKVCEEVDIWVYKNLKKGDLVAKILKQINK